MDGDLKKVVNFLEEKVHPLIHRRSQGVHWVHVHSPGRGKNLGPNLQGKVVSGSAPPGTECAPKAEQEAIF